jgi:hypothetical protein
MGMWNNHRQRQAGKYARANYRLQRWQAERQWRMDQVALAQLKVTVRRAIEDSIPPRPDRP